MACRIKEPHGSRICPACGKPRCAHNYPAGVSPGNGACVYCHTAQTKITAADRAFSWADPVLRSRFFAKTARDDRTGCLVWQGKIEKRTGYGMFRIRCKMVRAHRVSFALKHGRYPRGVTRHKCDNPSCVEDQHLLEGTQKQNVHDAIDRKRWSPYHPRKGTAHHFAKLTDDDVRAIRAAPRGSLALARAYSIAYSTLKNIRTRKTWSHVDA